MSSSFYMKQNILFITHVCGKKKKKVKSSLLSILHKTCFSRANNIKHHSSTHKSNPYNNTMI